MEWLEFKRLRNKNSVLWKIFRKNVTLLSYIQHSHLYRKFQNFLFSNTPLPIARSPQNLYSKPPSCFRETRAPLATFAEFRKYNTPARSRQADIHFGSLALPLVGEILEILRPGRRSKLLEPAIIGKSEETFSIVRGKFEAAKRSEDAAAW